MSQDVNLDWGNREFIEKVEVSVRKCIDFLNHFHESAKYRLSDVDQRLTSLERKLDFLEAQLEHCDPAKRQAQPKPFKGSIFDPEIRRQQIQKQIERRQKQQKTFTNQIIAPKKSDNAKMIVGNAKKAGPTATEPTKPEPAKPEPTKPNTAPPDNTSANIKPPIPIKSQISQKQMKENEKEKDEKSTDDDTKSASKPIAPNRPPPPSAAQAQADLARGQVPPGPPVPPSSGEIPSPPKKEGFPHENANEIDLLVVEPGNGPIPEPNSSVEIEYTGYLPDGSEFITHREQIALGKKQNIKGLEQGVCQMKVGSKCKLWIPSKLGYGARGAPPLIPANADLTFHITLHSIVG
jgi:hypothetical protein